jgi:hypothetical protein
VSDFIITCGPWRIRTASAIGDDHAEVSYVHDGETDGDSEVLTIETHTDLIPLRDAIAEYLTAAGVTE